MATGPWFYCLKHNTVETRDGCAERHRLGPYETREEAEHALQLGGRAGEADHRGGPRLGGRLTAAVPRPGMIGRRRRAVRCREKGLT